MRNTALLFSLALTACQASESEGNLVPTHYQIGVVHREVTTANPEAQLWFDRGLALTYGFNHEEAIRCFENAAKADPGCAMAHWGKAYALGPNYNNTEMSEESSAAALQSLEKAIENRSSCTQVERDLIEALRSRYASPASVAGKDGDRTPLEAAYAKAMRKVRRAHPEDADVAALTGEALMMLRPWKLWSPDGTPAPEIPEIREVLESGLAKWPNHPALCHLYIHAMEAGPEAAAAVPAAESLETLTPGIGHLVHMPSHIYIWTGRYADAVRVNQAAVEVDAAYVEHAGRANFYTLYRLHNLHFIAYGAMFTGQREVALEASRRVAEEVPSELLPTMIDLLDVFVATPYHVMVRFGMWEDMLKEPEPDAKLLATRAVWHYARGVALASLGRVEEATKEQAVFLQAKAAVPASRLLFNNPVSKILTVAEAVLAGEVEYRRGDYDRAFASLRRAVELDRQLNYDEPWGWMEPAAHALGALLTEQGRCEEAAEVYRKNLARFPENGWALHGLTECLRKLGRDSESATVRTRFAKAFEHADIEIPGSCFCRTKF